MTMYGTTTFEDSFMGSTGTSLKLPKRKQFQVKSIDLALRSSKRASIRPLIIFNYSMVVFSVFFAVEFILVFFSKSIINGFVSLSALTTSLGLFWVFRTLQADYEKNA